MRSRELNDHDAIVPSLKEVGREPHCSIPAMETSWNEGQLGSLVGGVSNRWFHAMESMNVSMPLPMSLPVYRIHFE
jgi:hypothetical protein